MQLQVINSLELLFLTSWGSSVIKWYICSLVRCIYTAVCRRAGSGCDSLEVTVAGSFSQQSVPGARIGRLDCTVASAILKPHHALQSSPSLLMADCDIP